MRSPENVPRTRFLNGQTAPVTADGTVSFRVVGYVDLHPRGASVDLDVTLHAVLYVPDASLNMLSVKSLRAYGCCVRFGWAASVTMFLGLAA